jgi:acetyl esterase/lipase
MLFLPRIDPQVPLTLRPGLEYGRAGGQPLLLDLISPSDHAATPRPAAIWLHGGGWYAGGRESGPTYWCALLAAHGFVTASVDYRLSGDAVFPAQIHDVKAAIRWLRSNAETYQFDPDRIGIWGHSAGGHLAALAAVTGDLPDLEGNGSPSGSSAVQAAAIASTYTDFVNTGTDGDHPVLAKLFGGTRAETQDQRRRASPVAHVRDHQAAPPFLIAHGTLDETVPYEQAERLHAALTAAGTSAELVTIEGGYHNWNATPDSTWPKVRYLEFAHLALRFFLRTL